jgi:hypothetical protein
MTAGLPKLSALGSLMLFKTSVSLLKIGDIFFTMSLSTNWHKAGEKKS